MAEDDDWRLLQRYVQGGSTEALNELARRHLPMVHAVAMRQVNDAHLAEEVAQVVFMLLMRQAAKLSANVVIGGWLFNAARLTAMNMRRKDWRRREHEETAASMNMEATAESTSRSHDELMPLLDAAIARLPRGDRDAVVLRFFEGKSFREVGQALQVTENAARQRVLRAVGKLRSRIAGAGVALSVDAVSASLAATAALQPPAELMGRVVSAVNASSATRTSSSAVEAMLRIMLMAKLKTMAVSVGVAVILLVIGGGIVYVAAQKPAAPAALAAADLPGSPNAAFLQLLGAVRAGNVDALIDAFEPLNVKQEASLRGMAGGIEATAALRSAVAARFGEAEAQQLMEQLRIDPPVEVRTAVARVLPAINGDRAELKIAQLGTIWFVKVAGRWKVSSSMLEGQLGRMFSEMTSAAPELERIAAEVKAGKYADVVKLRRELQKTVAALSNKDPSGEAPARAAVLGPGATPKETLAAYYWAMVNGDEGAALSLLHHPSPGQASAVRRLVKLYSAGEKVRAATAERFGKGVARNTVLTLGLDCGITAAMLESAPETITGDSATVELASIGRMELVRIDGRWRFASKQVNDANRAWDDRLMEHYLPMNLQLAADIKAGRYGKPGQLQAVVEKLSKELKEDHARFAGRH
jgi:RNA polymerase sigma factor (sigma-70 family)